jgi:hypothetical protein
MLRRPHHVDVRICRMCWGKGYFHGEPCPTCFGSQDEEIKAEQEEDEDNTAPDGSHVDTSDIPELGEEWFKTARLVLPSDPPAKLK